MKLMEHQVKVLEESKDLNKVAYYYDMGLGKTFIGAEKAVTLGKKILVVCQKSKVEDWIIHFTTNYDNCIVNNLSKKLELDYYIALATNPDTSNIYVGVINYDLVWRRKELSNLTDFTLILDESSLIQNSTSKRSKFILNRLSPTNVILLSGTPVSGKYEKLLSQIHLLGWNITKDCFENTYCIKAPNREGYYDIVGYKNIERLNRKLREYGCFFKKTEEVLSLPEQRFICKYVNTTKEYKKFMRDGIVNINNIELIGDTSLTKLLYARMLCGAYSEDKIEALKDLIESTEDRLIIFYNFDIELEAIKKVIPEDRPLSYINGKCKDLSSYEQFDNSITLCQYQSASMGHNLQLASKCIYFSPTLSCDMFEQSKKRIHRIGQSKKCTYYQLISGVEHHIYATLDMRKDYTDKLFEEVLMSGKCN